MAKDKFARFLALDALDNSGKAKQLDISVPMRVTFGEPVVLVPETTLEFHRDGENDITVNGTRHFAIGKYNKDKDVEGKDYSYAFSVGNGTSEEARSNAFTLDWEGNGCYQGKIESQSGVLKLGDTEVTGKQLKALLALLMPTA